jgi:hypothetical protein
MLLRTWRPVAFSTAWMISRTEYPWPSRDSWPEIFRLSCLKLLPGVARPEHAHPQDRRHECSRVCMCRRPSRSRIHKLAKLARSHLPLPVQVESNEFPDGVILDFSAGIRFGSVEIAEPYRVQCVSAVISFERILKKELGSAIGINRLSRRLLGDRKMSGMPYTAHVEENTTAGYRRPARSSAGCRGNVVAKVLARTCDRFSNIGMRGKMHHRIHAVQDRAQPCCVANVAFNQLEAPREFSPSRRKIVVITTS